MREKVKKKDGMRATGRQRETGTLQLKGNCG